MPALFSMLYFNSFYPSAISGGGHYFYPRLIDDKTEAQRGSVTHGRSHSSQVAELGLENLVVWLGTPCSQHHTT